MCPMLPKLVYKTYHVLWNIILIVHTVENLMTSRRAAGGSTELRISPMHDKYSRNEACGGGGGLEPLDVFLER